MNVAEQGKESESASRLLRQVADVALSLAAGLDADYIRFSLKDHARAVQAASLLAEIGDDRFNSTFKEAIRDSLEVSQ